MPTARPFAYNPGATGPIPGTEQIGDLAIGVDSLNYGDSVGGVRWWNGPDEDLGYVIAQSVPTGNQPNPDNTSAFVGFFRSSIKTEESFLTIANTVQAGATGEFTTGEQAVQWLNENGYWTSFESIPITTQFSQFFTQGQAPTVEIETAWNTFRSSLTESYTSFTWSSTNGSSITVTHPTNVQILADGLRTATITAVTIDSVSWRVGTGCGTPKIGGVAVEFANNGTCTTASTFALRPMINNANWGGTNQSTINAPSQTITLSFF